MHDVTDDSGVIGEDSICTGCVIATLKSEGWKQESSVDWQSVQQSCKPAPPQECDPDCQTTGWHDLDDVLDDLLRSCDAQPVAMLVAGVLGFLCSCGFLKAVCCKKKVSTQEPWASGPGSESLVQAEGTSAAPPAMQTPAKDTFCGQCGMKVPASMTFCCGAPGIAGCGAPVA